jgi:hypothetical protein
MGYLNINQKYLWTHGSANHFPIYSLLIWNVNDPGLSLLEKSKHWINPKMKI